MEFNFFRNLIGLKQPLNLVHCSSFGLVSVQIPILVRGRDTRNELLALTHDVPTRRRKLRRLRRSSDVAGRSTVKVVRLRSHGAHHHCSRVVSRGKNCFNSCFNSKRHVTDETREKTTLVILNLRIFKLTLLSSTTFFVVL